MQDFFVLVYYSKLIMDFLKSYRQPPHRLKSAFEKSNEISATLPWLIRQTANCFVSEYEELYINIMSAFCALVGSILSYSCEGWGFEKSKNIENIHLKFLKLLLINIEYGGIW